MDAGERNTDWVKDEAGNGRGEDQGPQTERRARNKRGREEGILIWLKTIIH